MLLVGARLNADFVEDEQVEVRELSDDLLLGLDGPRPPGASDALNHGADAGEEDRVPCCARDLRDGASEVRFARAAVSGHDDPVAVLDVRPDVFAELDHGRSGPLLLEVRCVEGLDGAIAKSRRDGEAPHDGRLLLFSLALRALAAERRDGCAVHSANDDGVLAVFFAAPPLQDFGPVGVLSQACGSDGSFRRFRIRSPGGVRRFRGSCPLRSVWALVQVENLIHIDFPFSGFHR